MILMKLADVNVHELVHALGMERVAWINAAKEESRPKTDAERITICVLAALQRALQSAANASDPEMGYAGAAFRPEP
jgi:hypothetical protein